jgi:hypothetical protein
MGFGLYDGYLQPPYSAGYLMPMALLSHFTFWTDLTHLSNADAAETSWWISWYKAHRLDLSGFSYEDTATDPIDGSAWLALQPWNADHGFLFVFRQGGSTATSSIALQGLEPARSYTLADARSGSSLGIFTGAGLMTGLALTLPAPYTSEVISIQANP